MYLSSTELRDEYEAYAKKRKLPDRAFTKDLSECKTLLKTRKIKFANDIQLSGPAEKINDITIETVPSGEGNERWTQLTIKSRLVGEQ